MVDLKCPNCAASISIDDTREFGFCSYCGTKVQLVQTVKIVHDGMVSISGVKSDEQMLATAKQMIDIGEASEAQKVLEKIVTTSPDCGEAWLGLAYIKGFMCDNYGVNITQLSKSLIANNSLTQIKQQVMSQLITNFTNSDEMRRAKKLMGERLCPIYDKLVATLQKEIDDYVTNYITKEQANSRSIIDKISKNKNLLDGYFYDTESDGQDSAFFLHNYCLYMYYRGAYYIVTDIISNKICLTFDIFEHRYNSSSIAKNITMEIHYATNNEIYTSLGRRWKSNTSSYANRYESTKSNRKRMGKCPVCGASTFLGICSERCKKNLY